MEMDGSDLGQVFLATTRLEKYNFMKLNRTEETMANYIIGEAEDDPFTKTPCMASLAQFNSLFLIDGYV